MIICTALTAVQEWTVILVTKAEIIDYLYEIHTHADYSIEDIADDLAVPVVRCKDCRWRDDQSGSTAWMPCRALITPNDFYCPRGERKDGDA